MKMCDRYSSWVEIDLGAIENNVRLIAGASKKQVMAVVKANGYGHGAAPVAKAALKAGANWLGVARVEEAYELRRAGLDCPVLLLGFLPKTQMEPAIANGLSITIWDKEQAGAAAKIGQRLGVPARLHLKVDTGMSRIGIQPQEALEFALALVATRGVDFEGIFTHFARADEADPATTKTQEDSFGRVINDLQSAGIRPKFVHAANSAASVARRPNEVANLVRAGIGMYGLHPSSQCPLPAGFRPSLAWKAVISQVKTLPPGRGVSYGHEYITRANERIGTIPVGYADGFRRIAGNTVLVRGQRVPVIGRVCMDQVMVQLDGVPEAIAGDEAVLIGVQDGESLPAEELAARWGTINYEVVCGIGPRVPRLYSGPGQPPR